ncbi:MAG: hypothetical protein IIU78_04215, partial [Alistipes sp.]|nr:hypothetical protein [Alistipes sp.]
GMIPEIEPRYRYTYFAHIFNGGYSSGYYFYLWAEVLDKDAFEAFKLSSDLCDKELAHSFRYDLLAQGGQKPGMEMYRKFRGADPDKTAMLKARGLWQEPEPEVQDVEIVESEIEKPDAKVQIVRPAVRPDNLNEAGKPLRPEMKKKPIKK